MFTTLETLQRWLFRLALLFMASPVFSIATMALFPHDRIFGGITAVINFFIGLALLRARRLLRSSPHSAMLMIERSYYTIVLTTLVAIGYDYYSRPDDGVLLALLKALCVVPLILLGKFMVERARILIMEPHILDLTGKTPN